MAAVHQSADTIIELTQLIERGPEAPDGRMPGQAPSSPAQSASRTPAISPLVANMIPGLTEKVGGLMDKFSFLEDRILRISDRLNRVEQSGAFKTGGPDGKEMKNEIARELRDNLASRMAGFDGRMEGLLKRLGDVEQKAVSASEELSRLRFDPDDMERRIADLGRARKEAEADFANKFHALSERLAGFEGALGDRIAAAVDAKTAVFDTAGLAQRVDALAEAKDLADKGFSSTIAELAGRLERFEGGLADAMGQYLADHAPAVKPEDLAQRLDALAEAREKAQSDFEGRLASLAGKLDGIEKGVEQSLSALRLDQGSLARECQEFDGRLQALAQAKDEAAAGFARRLEDLASQLSAMEAGLEGRLAEYAARASAQSADESKKELDSRLAALADDSASALASFQDELSVITDKVLGVENGIGLRIAQEVAGAEQNLNKTVDERLEAAIEARLGALRTQSQESARQLSDRLAETAQRLDALNGGMQERMERFLADRLPALRDASGQAEIERLSASLAELAGTSGKAEAGFQASLAELASRVQAFEGGFEAKVAALLDQKDKDIRADLGRLAEQDAQALAQQEQRISDLASRVEGFEAGLSGRVAGIVQDSQADLAERLEELASQGREQERKTAVRLDEFMEKISDLEDGIAQQVEGVVADKATEFDDRLRQLEEGLCGQPGELESRLDSIRQDIQPRVEEAVASTASELSQRIDELQKSTDASLDSLSRKVDGVGKAAGDRMDGLLFEKTAQLTERIRKVEENAGEQTGALAVRLALLEDGVEPRIAKALGAKAETLATQAREEADARISPLESRLGGLEGGLDARIEDAVGKSVAQAREEADARIAPLESRLGGLEDGLDARIGDAVGKSAAQAREEAEARIAPLESRLGGLEDGLDARIGDAVGKTAADAEHRADALESRLSVLDDGFNARVTGIVEEQSRAVEQRLQEAGEAGRKEAMSGISAVAERVDALERGFESFGKTAQLLESSAAGKAGSEAVQAVAGGLASLTGRLDELEAGLDGRVQAGTAALEASFDAKLAEMAEGHREVRGQTRVLRAQMSSLISAKDNIMEQVDGLKTSQQELGDSQTQRLDSLEERIGQAESKAREIAEATVLEQTGALQAKVASDFARQDEKLNSAMEDLRNNAEATTGPLQQSVAELKAAQEDFGGQGIRTAQRLDSLEERIGQAESKAREIAEAAVLEQTGALQAQISTLLSSKDSLMDQLANGFSRQDERLASAVDDLRRDIDAKVEAVKSAQEDLGGQGLRTAQRLDSLEERIGSAEDRVREIAQAAVLNQTGELREQIAGLAASRDSLADQLADGFSRQDEQLASAVDDLRRDIDAKVNAVQSAQEALGGELGSVQSALDRLGSPEALAESSAKAAVEPLRQSIDDLKAAQQELNGQGAGQNQRLDSLERRLDSAESAGEELATGQTALVQRLDGMADSLAAVEAKTADAGAERLADLATRLDGIEGRIDSSASQAQQLVDQAVRDQTGALSSQIRTLLSSRESLMSQISAGLSRQDVRLADAVEELRRDIDAKVGSLKGAQTALGGVLGDVRSALDQIGSPEALAQKSAEAATAALQQNLDELKAAQQQLGDSQAQRLDSLEDRLGQAEGRARELAEETVAPLRQNLDELKAAQQELGGQSAGQAQRLDSLEARLGRAEAAGEGIVSGQTALAKRLDGLQEEGGRSAREARERLDSMAESLAAIEDRVGSSAESRFTALASRLETTLRADIDAVKDAQEAGSSKIRATLDEMAARLDSQSGAGQEAGLAAVEEKVALLSASRSELENELSGKLADLGARLSAFEGRMREQVEERMPAQARSVTEVASRMGALEGRIDAAVLSMERKVAQLVSMAERQADLVQEADPALMEGIERLSRAIAHLLEKEERNQEALIALRRDADQALQRTTPKAVEQTAAEICARILREEIAALVADMEDAG